MFSTIITGVSAAKQPKPLAVTKGLPVGGPRQHRVRRHPYKEEGKEAQEAYNARGKPLYTRGRGYTSEC